MYSLQLLQLTERSRRIMTSKRRSILLASGGAIVAGGMVAYMGSKYCCNKPDSFGHCNGKSDNKEQSDKMVRHDEVLKECVPEKKGSPLKVLAGILQSQMGLKGAGRLLALVVIALLRTALSHRIAKLQAFLLRAAFLRDKQNFLRLITENLVLGLLISTLHSTAKYVTGSLSLQFRKIITLLIHAQYFQNMAYYKVSYVDGRISNPEQQIASDIPRFCSELCEFVEDNIMEIINGLHYAWHLCSYASPKYMLWMVAYVKGVNFIFKWISPSFGMLMAKEQQLEGEHRQLHSRLRTHAESIAFYGGESREHSYIQKKFKAVVEHMNVMLYHNWWFNIVQELLFRCLGATVAGAMMVEPFFLGKPRSGSLSSVVVHAETLSNLRYHSSVIIALFTSLGILLANQRKLYQLRGYAGRIHELMTVSEELSVKEASLPQRSWSTNFVSEASYIDFDAVKVVTPSGNVLLRDLTLRVESGSNVLVTGPNGSGKSSLFRVLGGLWPLMSGHIVKPGVGSNLNKEVFYVPQRPYVSIGTLYDQIIYPFTAEKEVQPPTHYEMVELLRYVDLGHLLDRYPLDKEINWADELSLGEQQRLGMARLFYHKPKFAILDECTSAVTNDMEERFCKRVRAMGMSCITISHRPALVAFHDMVLSLDGEGGWSVRYKSKDSPVRTEVGFNAMKVSTTDRQNDAMTVQHAFSNAGKDSPFSDEKSQSYISELIATSPLKDLDVPLPIMPQLQTAHRSLLSRVVAMFKIVVPTVYDKQGLRILAVAVLVGLTSWVSYIMTALQGSSTKFVLQQDSSTYVRLYGASMLFNAVSCFISPSLSHLTSRLSLEWRIRLTKHLLKNYFRKNACYRVFNTSDTNVDADQRITQDLQKLTADLSGLITGLLKPSVDMLWLTWKMKQLTGQRGVAMLYVYMIFGLGFLRSFSPHFGDLASREQQLEGKFRFMHERLRSHAESIAFFGGGAREKVMIESRFWDLLCHLELYNKKKWLFGILDDFITKQLSQCASSSFSLIYAMEYEGVKSLNSMQGDLADGLRYVGAIATMSFTNFGEILQLQKKFTELSGDVNRVFELEELLDAAQSDDPVSSSNLIPTKPETSHSDDIISFSKVDIVTPAQKMLARNLTFDITPGKNLLITGPNGSGKSCVFRVLRGLWPLINGRLVKPCQPIGKEVGCTCDVFYVPQRTYMCLGTLRDQVIYPLSHEEAERRMLELYCKGKPSLNATNFLDTHLKTILENVKLLYLLEREDGWDAVQKWEDILSLGEQQRLGMARLFFHKPKFGILDECTNATSIDVEEHLYKLAEDMGITFVTSSQRPALIQYHSKELRLVDGKGKWELYSIKH